jgi:hypothetical protein
MNAQPTYCRPLAAAALTCAIAAAMAVAADGPAATGGKKPAAKSSAAAAKAGSAAKPAAASKPAKDDWAEPMDYGPFLATSVARPGGKPLKTESFASADVPKFPVDRVPDLIAAKGVVIPVGPKGPGKEAAATVCFDTDTLSMSGWTGGWLDLKGSMFTNHKGTEQVTLAGTEQFHVDGPGCGGADSKDTADPRRDKLGPIPPTWGRYDGLHVSGDKIVLSYHVGPTEVLEVPGFEGEGDHGYFTRSVRVAPSDRPITLAICTIRGERILRTDRLQAVVSLGTLDTAVGVTGPIPGAELAIAQRKLWLKVAASKEPTLFKVLIRGAAGASLEGLGRAIATSPKPVDPTPLLTGGPKRYEPITTAGKLGEAPAASAKKAADPAFVVDTLTLPDKNPSNAWFRCTGLDFFADGRAAVSTINGDVWVVAGIDDSLAHLTWTRFATGLYQPMGLKVVDDKVYVRGRDQITRLHDLNGDGEADFYENFSNEGVTHPSYHGFVFDLQTDPAGNFYYARGGLGMEPTIEGHGRLMKLSKDGKTATPVATGLRAPNGLGAGPDKWVLVGDNQGNWIPTSQVHLVDPTTVSPGGGGTPGGGTPLPFLGFLPHHHQAKQPTEPARPLVFVPYKLDNSSGGQCYISGAAWGPYQGQYVHTSFGAACVTLLLPDAATPAGEVPKQAAVVRLPLDFPTGVMRPRFNPKDGQLYLTGVGGGWQTKGTADGGLYRVRNTGKPGFAPTKFAVVPGGVRLSFPQPLDKTEAADPQNYAVEQWNYKWTEKYGSPEFSAKTPGKAGHDEVEVKAAALSADGLTVTLTLASLVPVDQMSVQCNLKTAGGAEFEQTVYTTINAVPK